MRLPHYAPISLLPPGTFPRGRTEFNLGVKVVKSKRRDGAQRLGERRRCLLCCRFLTGMSGLISCVVCVSKEQSLTGRLSEADGAAVNVRWEDEKRGGKTTSKGLSMQSVNTQGGLI